MTKQFTANNLVLNLDKTNIMKFITRNSAHSTLHIGYKEKNIEETLNTKFLGLQIDNHIYWKNHTEEMIPKLSAACYAIRSMVHISNMNTLISVYDAYFHYSIKYGRIFWSNSHNSGNIFTLQKQITRITAGAEHRTSCRSLFKQLEILPVPCQHTPSLMSFIINNQETFKQIHLYTILIQGINIIFIGQMSTYLVFKELHSMLA